MKRKGCPRRNKLFLVFVLTLSSYVSCFVMSRILRFHMTADALQCYRLLMLTQRGPTSSLAVTPFLVASNVSDCMEVLLQPSFSGE